LQCLTLLIDPLSVYAWETGLADWGQHFHIAGLLKGMSFLETLKGVTIAMRLDTIYSWHKLQLGASEWDDLCGSEVWKNLDRVLSSALAPALQEVVIQLQLDKRPRYKRKEDIVEQFKTSMRPSMPLLRERGVLSLRVVFEL
jgi:hypothetical protein